MSELTIPSVSFVENAEGLIAVGGTPTGIVAVVGPAQAGPVGVMTQPKGFVDARETYFGGDLVDALELVFINGASSVIAMRVASGEQPAELLLTKDGVTGSAITARTPGTWGKGITCEIGPEEWYDDVDWVWDPDEDATLPAAADPSTITAVAGRARVGVRRKWAGNLTVELGAEPFSKTFPELQGCPAGNLKASHNAAGGAPGTAKANDLYKWDDASGTLTVVKGAGTLSIAVAGEDRELSTPHVLVTIMTTSSAPPTYTASWIGAKPASPVVLSFRPVAAQVMTLRLTRAAPGGTAKVVAKESYELTSGYQFAQDARSSRLITVVDAPGDGPWDAMPPTPMVGGTDGDAVSGLQPALETALAGLNERDVNIVVLAGESSTVYPKLLAAHVGASVGLARERIGVFDAPSPLGESLEHESSERLVAVAPRLRSVGDRSGATFRTLAPAVAGRIAALPPHHSLTSRDVLIPDGWELDLDGRPGPVLQADLVRAGVLAVVPVPRAGTRVIRGVTAAPEGSPFGLVPTRRTVDFARYQVRAASRPYIGRLNNDLVRNALRATIDGALSAMVREEMLVDYTLDVSSPRTDQVRGLVHVTIGLQPTFSIEFIRVVMDLQ